MLLKEANHSGLSPAALERDLRLCEKQSARRCCAIVRPGNPIRAPIRDRSDARLSRLTRMCAGLEVDDRPAAARAGCVVLEAEIRKAHANRKEAKTEAFPD